MPSVSAGLNSKRDCAWNVESFLRRMNGVDEIGLDYYFTDLDRVPV